VNVDKSKLHTFVKEKETELAGTFTFISKKKSLLPFCPIKIKIQPTSAF
jgi:hypothetical protein